MGRRLFVCKYPGCSTRPAKRSNCERHVWLMHLRRNAMQPGQDSDKMPCAMDFDRATVEPYIERWEGPRTVREFREHDTLRPKSSSVTSMTEATAAMALAQMPINGSKEQVIRSSSHVMDSTAPTPMVHTPSTLTPNGVTPNPLTPPLMDASGLGVSRSPTGDTFVMGGHPATRDPRHYGIAAAPSQEGPSYSPGHHDYHPHQYQRYHGGHAPGAPHVAHHVPEITAAAGARRQQAGGDSGGLYGGSMDAIMTSPYARPGHSDQLAYGPPEGREYHEQAQVPHSAYYHMDGPPSSSSSSSGGWGPPYAHHQQQQYTYSRGADYAHPYKTHSSRALMYRPAHYGADSQDSHRHRVMRRMTVAAPNGWASSNTTRSNTPAGYEEDAAAAAAALVGPTGAPVRRVVSSSSGNHDTSSDPPGYLQHYSQPAPEHHNHLRQRQLSEPVTGRSSGINSNSADSAVWRPW